MMKKKTKYFMDPYPSCSFPAGEAAMARLKHQYLFEDYQELLKETVEKRERLQKAMQKKLKLLAEVKFLAKKYESFTKSSKAFPCKTKKQSLKILFPPNQLIRPPLPPTKAELPKKEERNCKAKEAKVQNARKLIDLNQVSLPNDEETDAFEVELEHLKTEKLRRSLLEGNIMADDLKLSACRDIGSGSNRSGKRKITWLDQLTLRV
ncbi:uncharacterized protein LOC110027078 [Phalaenopsis equestris]|uniref:uncharacterized protein LOC110027078 n=1 Tax=Phalaenopsis equestris TaxID=78828 RepID=UPI0009E1B9D0|nr:uncharacterized protein LOC110027078 [Phalaenopsis equestris]